MLALSLILMVFSICQAQARARLPAAPALAMTAHAHHPTAHDAHATGHAADCHGDCLHLQSHPDASQSMQLPDVSPVLLALLPAEPLLSPITTRALAYHPPSPADADPPATLRFQRFLN